MIKIRKFSEFINEAKSVQEIVKDLARHLSFDKDVIKYLNTSRSKREIGWRELLQSKLHGDNLEYVTYITKNMVADYNPQITGPVSFKSNGEEDFDNTTVVDTSRFNDMDPDEKIDDLNRRLTGVENVLGIDPDDEDTLDKAMKISKDLGFETIEDEDDEDDEKEEEE